MKYSEILIDLRNLIPCCSHSGYYASGKENSFVRNVVCTPGQDDDITRCNRPRWSFNSACRGYLAFISCHKQSWAGIHLAMSHKRSKIHHLILEEAGYAYRDDIHIPGSGIRIDYNIHDIAGLKIVGSSGIGMTIVYNHPLSHQFVIQNSSILNTASHGLRFLSPFMTMSRLNISGSGGKGILYESTWDGTNTHTVDVASPEVLKVLPLCFQNSVFLEPDKTFYYVFKNWNSFKTSCDLVFTTEPGYKIVIQIIHYDFNYYYYHYYYYYYGYNNLQIFDGVNGTYQDRMWDLRQLDWRDRPIINSTGNHLFLRCLRYHSPNLHFFIFTVKGKYLANNFLDSGQNMKVLWRTLKVIKISDPVNVCNSKVKRALLNSETAKREK